jgi:hypothetical protein
MAESKKDAQAKPADAETRELDEAYGTEPEPGGVELSNWEFLNRAPTSEEIVKLLAGLPMWWGVAPVEFADYVQALPSTKKVKVKKLVRGKELKVDEYVEVYSIYFSVTGRVQMLRAAQERNGWVVDFVPEPVTPTQIPGYLEHGDRLVYREYVEIWAPQAPAEESQAGWLIGASGDGYSRLGKRPGTAWVPSSGGKQAAGTNPYEKVETSARGRALGAWGIGVLPGSGIASLEEMLAITGNRAAMDAEAAVIGSGTGPAEESPKTDDDLITAILTKSEDLRQRSGQTDGQMLERIAKFASERCNADVVTERSEDGTPTTVDLTRLKRGQLVLMHNRIKETLAQAIAADAD